MQNKALWINSFKDEIEPSEPLCANHKILKLQISLQWTIACFEQLQWTIACYDQLHD